MDATASFFFLIVYAIDLVKRDPFNHLWIIAIGAAIVYLSVKGVMIVVRSSPSDDDDGNDQPPRSARSYK